jgi:hypothetical protein
MGQLQGKPDFDRVLARFEAWWEGAILDRPPVTLHVRPERAARLPEKRHAGHRERRLDLEYALDRFEAGLEAATFVGESFPRFEPDVGPELCATVFGCDLEFAPTTSYAVPIVRASRDILGLKPDPDTPYWNAIRRATDLSLERGQGRWITAMPDLHTNGDLVASLRDPQGMCLDLATDLEGVRAACEHVTDAYALLFDDLWSRIASRGQPCTTWTPYLHAGRAYMSNCDFICMISPRMFQEAILPSLVREMRFLERNMFHLDGPGALRHLDALLDCPELDAVQWVYGAGQGPAARWVEVYRRVQAAGKALQLLAEDLDDAKAVAEHLRPEGVWFCPHGGYSRAEADAFIRWAERWAARKASD